MPIANVIITADCPAGSGDIIDLWAGESNISSEHMTINFLSSREQFGQAYKVMANLMLPSLWPTTEISSIQSGLAKALARYFGLADGEVHVVTTIISSGMVVEAGEEISWSIS